MLHTPVDSSLWTEPRQACDVVQVVHHVVQEVLPERQHGELATRSTGARTRSHWSSRHRVEPRGRDVGRVRQLVATTAGSCRSYRSASAVASWSQFSNSGSSCVSSSSRRPSKIRRTSRTCAPYSSVDHVVGRRADAGVGAVQRGDPARREVAHGPADGRAVDVRGGEPALGAPLRQDPGPVLGVGLDLFVRRHARNASRVRHSQPASRRCPADRSRTVAAPVAGRRRSVPRPGATISPAIQPSSRVARRRARALVRR